MYARWGFGAGSEKVLAAKGVSQNTMPYSGRGLSTLSKLLSFDHGFVSDLQQEGILRYESRCGKCDIALRAVCLKTFGGRPHQRPPDVALG